MINSLSLCHLRVRGGTLLNGNGTGGSPDGTIAITPKVIDIRGNSTPTSSNKAADMQLEIIRQFTSVNVPFKDHRIERRGEPAPEILIRSLPTMTLYSDKGLDIFDQITYNPEYYLTNAEINIFETYAKEIVGNINDGDCLIELGCGYFSYN
jgi:L-histidine Nalpha-methyltransferase / hercynylcysteine S-oxide synthase